MEERLNDLDDTVNQRLATIENSPIVADIITK